MPARKITFEEAVTRLDAIVRQMEKGDATLEESLKLFEEGANLIKLCNKLLDEAQQKVMVLSKGPDGEPVAAPFDAEEQ
ncbi:MAG: exodeoxyribonuclease VII small subunit [Oscillospiraceae bacterium]|jgi:exodeoxyribonuclease VII small subunit